MVVTQETEGGGQNTADLGPWTTPKWTTETE